MTRNRTMAMSKKAPRRKVIGWHFFGTTEKMMHLSCGHEVRVYAHCREDKQKTFLCFACFRSECVSHKNLIEVDGRGNYCGDCGFQKWILNDLSNETHQE